MIQILNYMAFSQSWIEAAFSNKSMAKNFINLLDKNYSSKKKKPYRTRKLGKG